MWTMYNVRNNQEFAVLRNIHLIWVIQRISCQNDLVPLRLRCLIITLGASVPTWNAVVSLALQRSICLPCPFCCSCVSCLFCKPLSSFPLEHFLLSSLSYHHCTEGSLLQTQTKQSLHVFKNCPFLTVGVMKW